MARHPVGCRPERLCAPLRDHRAEHLGGFVDLLLRLAGLGPRDGHKPMDVRVRQPLHAKTTPTLAARFPGWRAAHQPLSDPEGEALLPDALRASQQDHLGQGILRHGADYVVTGGGVADQGGQRHGKEGSARSRKW